MKFPALVCFLLLLGQLTLFSQQEPEGILLLQEPGSTYTEAIEYRSYHQDNALFATVVTTKGERKKMKAAAVIAALLYPTPGFDSSFENVAEVNLQKIAQLEAHYPRVQAPLASARRKWERAGSFPREQGPAGRGCGPRVKFSRSRFEFAKGRAPHRRNRACGNRNSRDWRQHSSA